MESEMAAELRFHVEARARDLMQEGVPAAEAQRRARIEFGGMDQTKEECRRAKRVGVADGLLQDLRFGWRMLRKSPGFTAIAILTLALGIGANTAIFSIVHAVMLSSLPIQDPNGLRVVQWLSNETHGGGTSSYGDCSPVLTSAAGRKRGCSLSYPMFQEMRRQKAIFSGAAAFAGPTSVILGGVGQASVAEAGMVSGDYFQVLGVNPARGRVFDLADESRGAEPVVVLSYDYWQKAFEGSDEAIGRTIRLNDFPFRIVGVAEARFTRLTPGKAQDLWIPLPAAPRIGSFAEHDLDDSSNWWLVVVARLKGGIGAEHAQAATSLLFRNSVLHGKKPLLKEKDDPQIALLPAQRALVGIRSRLATPLYILTAAVGMVLLITCANLAGLLLARARGREREMAVRAALGGSPRRITRQLLTESLMLSAAGGGVGVLLAYWGASWLTLFVSSNSYSPLVLNVTMNGTVLAFTALTAMLTGILFGLAPALRSSGVQASSALKDSGSTLAAGKHAGSRRFSTGSVLVIGQVALSVVMLVGAGLTVRSLANLKSVDPGFETRNLLHFSIRPTQVGYAVERLPSFYDELQRKLEALPGVTSVSYANGVLLDGSLWSSQVHIQGMRENTQVETNMLAVGPDYFATMHIPIVSGRALSANDIRSRPGVALVNETFVRRYLRGRNPVGLQLTGGSDENRLDREIIGVVGDTRYVGLRESVEPTTYVPMSGSRVFFEVRTATEPATLIAAVRHLLGQIDPDLPVTELRTQKQAVDRLLFNERLVARLSTLFAGLAAVLACLGLFGLLSYEVARRTQEIGIRTALGAPRGQVLAMILRQGLALAVCGAGAGILAALFATRYLKTLLYGVPATDAVTFGAVASLLVGVALLASWIPARKATRVDPMVALRRE
jgi:predicted permease